MVFSPPKDLIQQFQLSGNVRYVQQWVRRNAEKKGDPNEWRWRRAPEKPNLLHGDWSLDMGTGATVGAGMYPAKYSFDATSATCAELGGTLLLPPALPDFVVYNTSLTGSATQATIAAFTNLYVGTCSTVKIDSPNLYWAYNTSTTGAIVTSVVLSGDGNQVAFVQNNASTATLVLLKWAPYDGSLASPTTPVNSVSAAAYNTCVTTTAGPCMFTIPFSTANGGAAAFDTNSSPFYDYPHDTLYVGNNTGYLHKFTPVFKGAPAEVVSIGTAGSKWPCRPGTSVLTSPVFDDGTGRIFVGDLGGLLHRVDATIGGGTGGIVASGTLGAIADSPILDSSTGNLYVFVRGDTGAGAAKRAGIYQFTTSFAAGSTGTETQVSSNSTLPKTALYTGDFDNIYYTSPGGTGNMHVCSTGSLAGTTRAELWQIPVTLGVLDTRRRQGPSL